MPKALNPARLLAAASLLAMLAAPAAQAQDAASEHTIAANRAVAASLALDDPRDQDDARRGKIGEIPDGLILDDKGNVVWDVRAYRFLDDPKAPDTVNPSLWRQARMNREHGLFEVVKGGIYQVRGYDISGMTLVKGKTGWIVIDPLTTEEAARASFALAEKHLGKIRIAAIIFTHSHGDHFGGVGGIVTREQVERDKIRIIAPHGFSEEATSENVLAGNAMSRRANYMFGMLLAPGPMGQVDTGLGPRIAKGTLGFLQNTESIGPEGGKVMIDGIEFDFLDAEGTEAPAEFLFYIPKYKALHTSEVMTKTLHNVLTLRGAQVRDTLHWSKVIDAALVRWGDVAEVQLASHNWPMWGQPRIKDYMTRQRDAYRYVHDRTLNLANNGATLHEMTANVADPTGSEFAARGYYGTINHNMKAVYQRYFGWWDGNPANYNPIPPQESAVKYVALMGGADKVLAAGREAIAAGEYRWAAELLNKLVFAEPAREDARLALASAYDQLGYQAESGAWRNYYLGAASTLRGKDIAVSFSGGQSRAFISAIPTAAFFDTMATRFDSAKGAKITGTFQFILPDTRESVEVMVNNGVEFPRYGGKAASPTATITLDRATLDDVITGTAQFPALMREGKVKVEGDMAAFIGWFALHPPVDPKFNVVVP